MYQAHTVEAQLEVSSYVGSKLRGVPEEEISCHVEHVRYNKQFPVLIVTKAMMFFKCRKENLRYILSIPPGPNPQPNPILTRNSKSPPRFNSLPPHKQIFMKIQWDLTDCCQSDPKTHSLDTQSREKQLLLLLQNF